MLALVMCGASTSAVGATVWKEHPTIRSLIKMITSDRYRFPTVDCDESGRNETKRAEQTARDKVSDQDFTSSKEWASAVLTGGTRLTGNTNC